MIKYYHLFIIIYGIVPQNETDFSAFGDTFWQTKRSLLCVKHSSKNADAIRDNQLVDERMREERVGLTD